MTSLHSMAAPDMPDFGAFCMASYKTFMIFYAFVKRSKFLDGHLR